MAELATGTDEAMVRSAAATLTLNPYQLVWHYCRAALDKHQGNVSATARALGMHRRTLQRILTQRRPEALNG